ncbi:AMP-binding protein, partial [Intrasporangium sp.]|uniref:AMP-binding protein n=1 Tax=Intrasporangium sp. TaxID=1925024 RepID=UPI002939E4D2
MKLVEQLAVLARRGVLLPGRPDRVARQLAALQLWGFGLAGEARQAAARSPDRVAVIDEERGAATYAQLLEGSERAAAVLAAALGGAPEGEPRARVGLLCRNHLGLVEVLIGASSIGVDVVLLNTGLSRAQVRAVVRDQGLALLVHDRDLTEVAAGASEASEVSEASGASEAWGASEASGDLCPLLDEDELLRRMHAVPREDLGSSAPPSRRGRTIVLTSGTTGTPKGARRPHPRNFAALASILDRIPFGVGETVLLSAPIFHTWGLAGLQLCLGLRSTMVLQRRFDPQVARSALRRHGCQGMFAAPVMVQRMIDLADDGLGPDGAGEGGARVGRLGGARLRVVALSGSLLPSGLATRFMAAYGPVLYNLYGSTEVSWVSVATPADLAADPDCAGRPPRGTTVAIVDETGAAVADGDVGRIFVGNDLLFDGYTDGASRPTWHGLVSTGDLGRLVDGRLHVEGREDDLVISGGENVYPRELEAAIARLPEVREVSVFGVPDVEFGQRLVACVAFRAGHGLAADEVVARVRPQVSRPALPRDVVVLDELPRNATGKV